MGLLETRSTLVLWIIAVSGLDGPHPAFTAGAAAESGAWPRTPPAHPPVERDVNRDHVIGDLEQVEAAGFRVPRRQ